MSALLPWKPLRELERMARRWDTLFPRFYEDVEEGAEEFVPPIESYRKNGNLVVRADVPGLDPKDIEVSLLDNVLTIKGERKSEKEVKKDDYLRREVSYGSFERRMNLPSGASTENIKASFRNGVVEVTIPMAKEAAAKKIPLEAEAEKKIEVEKK